MTYQLSSAFKNIRSHRLRSFSNKTHHIAHKGFLGKEKHLLVSKYVFILGRPKQSSQFSISLLSSSKIQPCSSVNSLNIVFTYQVWLIRSPAVRSDVQ